MLEMLVYVRERHGSVEAFLVHGGITEQQLQRLRTRLLGPA
jgi:hypothetical protein